ncbi:hypothetical protein AC249_AIPGENE1030 [Exaiptasia diaphana]|nr:hypothetical protein AC249_AIPGENE1030 [Exaiptasia diaphana]
MKSRRRSDHAEAQLIAFLRTCRDLDGSSSIFIEVFQNLSPCNDSRNETSCAEKIIQFKRYMESLGKEVQIIITFANFYRTEPTSRNSRSRANRNVQGLQMLRDNDIELRLLTGETEWRSFLCDDQLLNLSENERCACLSQALSFDGVCREMDDKWLFQKILGFAGNRLSFRELTCNALSRAQDNLCQPQVVLACKISYYINDRLYGPECAVFRSGVECAEAKLLHYLTRLYSNVSSLARFSCAHAYAYFEPVLIGAYDSRASCLCLCLCASEIHAYGIVESAMGASRLQTLNVCNTFHYLLQNSVN